MSKLLIGKYEATIYPEGDGWTGAIDIGYDGAGRRQRIKRKGRTKTIVKDKLIKLVDDREKGIKTDKETENYTFVSIMSDNDVPIEVIADLVGHNGPLTTGRVYRHQLKPVISKGATIMNTIFNQEEPTSKTTTTTRAKSA